MVGLPVLALAALAAWAAPVQAMITSHICADCHTMHNSQQNQPMSWEYDLGTKSLQPDSGPNPALTRYANCVACHTDTTTDQTAGANGAPIVFNSSQAPAQMLAGGNFYWVARGQTDQIEDARRGHNVVSLTTADSFGPPGGSISGQLQCAGTNGCHGDPALSDEFSAVKGSHHADDSAIDGSTVAKSYRFLGVSHSGSYQGVIGQESSNWERVIDAGHPHNEYLGNPTTSTNTISSLCGRCHGNLHNPAQFGATTPHFLHPTDVVIPNSGEYAYYNTQDGGLTKGPYNTIAPVARQDPVHTSDHDTVNLASDCVMCLSCHRAHGTANWKLLRWDYRNTYSPASGGCATCHTDKG